MPTQTLRLKASNSSLYPYPQLSSPPLPPRTEFQGVLVEIPAYEMREPIKMQGLGLAS